MLIIATLIQTRYRTCIGRINRRSYTVNISFPFCIVNLVVFRRIGNPVPSITLQRSVLMPSQEFVTLVNRYRETWHLAVIVMVNNIGRQSTSIGHEGHAERVRNKHNGHIHVVGWHLKCIVGTHRHIHHSGSIGQCN